LLDTNVILDVMLDRKPHASNSAKVMAAVETGKIEGSLCATTLTTIHYLASKAIGSKAAARQLAQLLQIFRIAPVTGPILSAALTGKSRDFEDSVLAEAARAIGANGIVTRNPKDFAISGLAIYSPADVVTMLAL
jgi:predicted nucleic acid-binding protein